MNRELKFRSWDYARKKMSYNPVVSDGTDGGATSSVYLNDAILCNEEELMQYTGLKDKNGKEIYEGDILCDYQYGTWQWRGIVKFSHGVFGAEWLSCIKSQSMVGSWGQKHNLRKFDDDILERQVVIGNIFENPELLVEPS